MASTLLGFTSGGETLFSGNPWSGQMVPWTEVRFKVSPVVSGVVYVGVALGLASGGITLNSGGALSSGGMADGWPLAAGDEYSIPRGQFSGQPDKLRALVVAAISGTMRLYHNVY